MPESFEDQLSRVRLMSEGDPTWDLSPNDQAALKAVLAKLEEIREPLRLIQDDDSHWYVIPCHRVDDFHAWEFAMSECHPWEMDWEPHRVNGPHAVQFYEWDE